MEPYENTLDKEERPYRRKRRCTSSRICIHSVEEERLVFQFASGLLSVICRNRFFVLGLIEATGPPFDGESGPSLYR